MIYTSCILLPPGYLQPSPGACGVEEGPDTREELRPVLPDPCPEGELQDELRGEGKTF